MAGEPPAGEVRAGARLVDALGYRAKVGVLVPATNTIVEPELAALQPPGVTNHVSRMSRVKRDTVDLEHYRKMLGRSLDMDEAIDVLVACAPDVIILGHSLDSFAGGIAGAKATQARIERLAGGVPAIVPSLALLEALEALGRPRDLALLTPWMQPGDELCMAFFAEAGYRIAAIKGMRHPTPLHIATADAALIERHVDEINVPAAQCIVKVGTNSAMSHLVPGLERRIGKPVLAVNIVMYWAALRRIGVDDRLPGAGTLLEKH